MVNYAKLNSKLVKDIFSWITNVKYWAIQRDQSMRWLVYLDWYRPFQRRDWSSGINVQNHCQMQLALMPCPVAPSFTTNLGTYLPLRWQLQSWKNNGGEEKRRSGKKASKTCCVWRKCLEILIQRTNDQGTTRGRILVERKWHLHLIAWRNTDYISIYA